MPTAPDWLATHVAATVNRTRPTLIAQFAGRPPISASERFLNGILPIAVGAFRQQLADWYNLHPGSEISFTSLDRLFITIVTGIRTEFLLGLNEQWENLSFDQALRRITTLEYVYEQNKLDWEETVRAWTSQLRHANPEKYHMWVLALRLTPVSEIREQLKLSASYAEISEQVRCIASDLAKALYAQLP